MEAEIKKVKISTPLTELLKNSEYHLKIATMLKLLGEVSAISDSLNLQDDSPTILFGPHVDESADEDVPPFYVSLNIHDAIIHNPMLD